MSSTYKWKHSVADAIANRNGTAVEEYLTWVVEPSLSAMEQKRKELVASGDPNSVFSLHDHVQLIERAYKTFCLAIHSMYEQQLRAYLTTSSGAATIDGVTPKRIEKGTWGDELNKLFLKVRGVALDSFDSYPILTELQMLANACRHGEGDSARKLHSAHPELWPSIKQFRWEDVLPVMPPAFLCVKLNQGHLSRYVAAISLFWLDMEARAMDSIVGVPITYLNSLRDRRAILLAAVNIIPEFKPTPHF